METDIPGFWFHPRGESLESHQVKLLDRLSHYLMQVRESEGWTAANCQYRTFRQFLVGIGVLSISDRVLQRHATMLHEVFRDDNIGV